MNHYFYDFELYISPELPIPSGNLSGENKKNLLIVVEEGDFTEENKAFLAKVLSAVNYDLAQDTSILVCHKDKAISVSSLMRDDTYQNCLIFGIEPKKIGFAMETILYQALTISDKNYLLGHNLEKIKTSSQFKKPLWTALQSIFKV